MWGIDRYQPRGRNMRLLALGMFLLGLTASYLLMLRLFKASELPIERHFVTPCPVKPVGEVYLEPIGIDAHNSSLRRADLGSQCSYP